MTLSCALTEPASLEEQVIKFCDSRYNMSYVQELFSTEGPREASETYHRAKKLPIEAIPICFAILADRKNQDNRRAGAIGLLSLLSQKSGVSAETKARMREAVLRALVEKRRDDDLAVPALGMEFLRRWGKDEDTAAVIPFLDHPRLAVSQYAEFTYTGIVRRTNPDAPVEKMMEEAKAQYRAQQAAQPPEPPPPSVPNPEAAAPSPPAPVAAASHAASKPLPLTTITFGIIALLATSFLVHRIRQKRRG